jgi:hypothetical protein
MLKPKKRATSKARHAGGRPAKFDEPSQPVTVTLPRRTLDQLRRISDDRAKAIVKAVDAVVENGTQKPLETEVVEVTSETGILVVPTNRSLQGIPWLTMIEVAPARHLLAVLRGTPIERLEVGLMDLVESAKESAPEEVPMLETLKNKIGELRRSERLSKAEIIFVATKVLGALAFV